jgi:hypothetical protein
LLTEFDQQNFPKVLIYENRGSALNDVYKRIHFVEFVDGRGGLLGLSKCRPDLAPQFFEPCRVGRRIFDGLVNVAVSEIILNEPCIRALIGKSEAARVAQHVRMSDQGEGGGFAALVQDN